MKYCLCMKIDLAARNDTRDTQDTRAERRHRGHKGTQGDTGDTRAHRGHKETQGTHGLKPVYLKLKERYIKQKQVKVVYEVCHNASEF